MDLVEIPESDFIRHPWEVSRRDFFTDIISPKLKEQPTKLLDIGSGDAWISQHLVVQKPNSLQVMCWDINYTDEYLQSLNLTSKDRLRFTAKKPDSRFDIVLALDVIEHIEDDDRFVSEVIYDVLSPEGVCLISVPAWPSLFGDHDVQLKHFRRYRPSEARDLICRNGFEILLEGGLFHSLMPVRWLANLRVGKSDSGGHQLAWGGPSWLAKIIGAVLSLDNFFSVLFAKVGWRVPGLSYWVLCRKR